MKYFQDGYVLGDRYGKVVDPFGHEWGIGNHTEDLTEEELTCRAKAAFAEMAKPQQAQEQSPRLSSAFATLTYKGVALMAKAIGL